VFTLVATVVAVVAVVALRFELPDQIFGLGDTRRFG
jgi:hypothetical protein